MLHGPSTSCGFFHALYYHTSPGIENKHTSIIRNCFIFKKGKRRYKSTKKHISRGNKSAAHKYISSYIMMYVRVGGAPPIWKRDQVQRLRRSRQRIEGRVINIVLDKNRDSSWCIISTNYNLLNKIKHTLILGIKSSSLNDQNFKHSHKGTTRNS